MRIKFYLDEDIPLSLSKALLNRGVNVLTTLKANLLGCSDYEQLLFAGKNKRTLITHNKIDFIKLHKLFIQKNISHSGLIVSDQLPTGILLKRTMKLWFSLDDKDMFNRIEYLSNWK